ncbi:MAG: PIG-L deacetylase family protein [archaeon]
MTAAPKNIFVICAHSDDQILGCGGSIIKYAKQGHTIITVIFSYGELTHMWLKPKEVIKTRIHESLKVDTVIGGKGVYFFGMKEGHFHKEFSRKKARELTKLFRRYPPAKIFTHSTDDTHPDHIATAQLVLDYCNKKRVKASVFGFDVWKLINIKHRNHVLLVEDITDTFLEKLKAIQCFKSQLFIIYVLFMRVFVMTLLAGMKYGFRHAETFYKMR